MTVFQDQKFIRRVSLMKL